MATRRQGLKRIKKRPLSERSEFRTLPVSVPGGACSPCEARTAIVGAAFFAPLFWRSKKAGRPPGRTPGYSPRQCKSHASSARKQQQWRLALCNRCSSNVKGNRNGRCAAPTPPASCRQHIPHLRRERLQRKRLAYHIHTL